MLRMSYRGHESPKYRNTTEIPVKNIGIPVKDRTIKDTNIGFN